MADEQQRPYLLRYFGDHLQQFLRLGGVNPFVEAHGYRGAELSGCQCPGLAGPSGGGTDD
ncbi:hypothetical protein ACODT5_06770 [Streptomyces sp. 5.8]|uniref:hypothetical protein n=1 Tax=Streptomyces sp. 5.8 TaxID=3406571 RepID=UPI003BB52B0F